MSATTTGALPAENPVARGGGSQLLSTENESRLFWRLRHTVARSLVRHALRNARLQVSAVLLASVVLWVGLFFLFFEGFSFVQTGLVHGGLRAQFVHAIFNVFFLALTVMLIFSSAIILYGSVYKSEEVAFLLTTPARAERIVLHKFHEAVFFSCWGFVLLGSPMLLAYGAVAGAPWYYYLLLAPFIIAFVLVPAALGAIACLLVVRLLPAVRVHALVAIATIIAVAGFVFGWRVLAYQNRDLMTFTWFQDVLARLEFSEQRLLPSWWLSSGLLEAAHPVQSTDGKTSWRESLMFLAVLSANALFFQLVLTKVAARVFRSSYSALQGLTNTRRRGKVGWLDRFMIWLCRPFPNPIRSFIVKDLRVFRRDPVQWSQFAIFFGLLSLYFFNVRRFDYAGALEQWVTIISFLNVAVVGLILSTFTTRFIFPMVSLEGRRFWILGTAPIRRDTILWGKFWFACAGSIPPCSILVLLSDVTLRVAARLPTVALIHQVSCCVLCVGLSALAVGLGARLPSLRETSPSRIAAGYGGTLNLVVSSLYIIVVVLATAVPCFFWAETAWMARHPLPGSLLFGGWIGLGTTGSVVLGLAVTLALGASATILPLRIGFRAFRRLEL